jgi:hypothetical protein
LKTPPTRPCTTRRRGPRSGGTQRGRWMCSSLAWARAAPSQVRVCVCVCVRVSVCACQWVLQAPRTLHTNAASHGTPHIPHTPHTRHARHTRHTRRQRARRTRRWALPQGAKALCAAGGRGACGEPRAVGCVGARVARASACVCVHRVCCTGCAAGRASQHFERLTHHITRLPARGHARRWQARLPPNPRHRRWLCAQGGAHKGAVAVCVCVWLCVWLCGCVCVAWGVSRGAGHTC